LAQAMSAGEPQRGRESAPRRAAASAPSVAAASVVAFCHGVNRWDGTPCRWTANALDAAAAPLLRGERFCFWHRPRRRTKPEDSQQLNLASFFGTPQKSQGKDEACPRLSISPVPDFSSLPSPARVADHSMPLQELTLEQQQVIDNNREKALEKRRLKEAEAAAAVASQSHDALSHSTQQRDHRTLVRELSQEQRSRIAESRHQAICRRQHKLMAETAGTEAAVHLGCSQRVSQTGVQGNEENQLTEEQRARIAGNKQRALERKHSKQNDEFVKGANAALHAYSPWPTPLSPSPLGRAQLTEIQLERITKNREEALDRKRQLQLPQTQTPAELKAQQDEPQPADDTMFARSRTPPRRPRRILMARMTCSPLPDPARFRSILVSSISQKVTDVT